MEWSIWPGMQLSHRPKLRIEPGVHVGAGTHVAGDGQLTIGRRTAMGPRVTITTATHDPADKTRRAGRIIEESVVIGEECWIGGEVMILSGVTIGRGAVVGARSLVTKDVPPNTLVVGSPARVIRELDELESPRDPGATFERTGSAFQTFLPSPE